MIVGLASAEGIILDVLDLHDKDRIVTFLTRDRGKKKGVAKGARAKHSRFGGQLQPLAKVQVTWFEKEGVELGRISSVELVRPAFHLMQDLEGILLGSYLADHMLELAQEDDPSDHFYRLLDSTLEALLAGVDQDLAARYFEIWALRLAGVFPPPKACPHCGRPFISEGGEEGAVLPPNGETLLCFDCGGRSGYVARPPTLDFLRRTSQGSLPAMAAEPPEKRTLREVEEICARVRRHFLQHELRSYEVIQKTKATL
ncbi:MAG TPA: DNA repair protein RecO [Thermoanaerobaculia bacterium]|nr:DNA repair protein RecO [Thermoanaerobaculia bacterium]